MIVFIVLKRLKLNFRIHNMTSLSHRRYPHNSIRTFISLFFPFFRFDVVDEKRTGWLCASFILKYDGIMCFFGIFFFFCLAFIIQPKVPYDLFGRSSLMHMNTSICSLFRMWRYVSKNQENHCGTPLKLLPLPTTVSKRRNKLQLWTVTNSPPAMLYKCNTSAWKYAATTMWCDAYNFLHAFFSVQNCEFI